MKLKKLKHIPRAQVSPIVRTVTVEHNQTMLMVKVPSTVTDNDAQGCIEYACDAARLNLVRGYSNFTKSFTAELTAMNMGFEVLELPFMFA